MDKYTVDLDKVLNDFEYSELTTEFAPCKTYVVPPSPTGSRAKCDSKHSITNVFHSLNEYLNSDITTSSKFSLETETASDDVDVKLGLTPSNTIDSNKEITVPHGMSTNLNQHIAVEMNTNDVQNGIVILPEMTTVQSDDIDLLNLVEIVPSNFHDDDYQDSSVQAQVTQNVIVTSDDLSANDNKNESEHTDDTIADVLTHIPVNTQEYAIQIIQENDHVSDIKPEEFARSPNEDEIIPVPVESDSQDAETENQVVGFDNLIVNESDLHQYLGELEKEFEILHDSPEEDGNLKRTEENIQLTRDGENSSELNESRTPQSSHSTCDGQSSSQLNESDPPQVSRSTCNQENPPHLDDEAEMPEQIKSVLDSVAKSQTVESARENSSGTERGRSASTAQNKVGTIPERVSEKPSTISGNLESEEKSQVKNTKANVEMGEIHDADSIQRPTNLGLGSEDTLSLKREINLIGNPGSTPYNNVYISKELQSGDVKRKPQDSDSSRSVSPTFSEISTETVSDTSETTGSESLSDDVQNTKRVPADKSVTVIENDTSGNTSCEHAVESSGDAQANIIEALQTEAQERGAEPAETEDTTPNVLNENRVEDLTEQQPAVQSDQDQSQDMVYWLGKQAPLWIPDSEALSCLHCDAKFTVIKRRHHCRACGLVLCSKCCNLKYRLEYMDAEARVCSRCYTILNRDTNSSSGSEASMVAANSPNRRPNPNNPMEYCSVVPPLQQISNVPQNPPTVMVPVGVLKRKGSSKAKSNKSVMFCDGIRPGSDLTKLDTDFEFTSNTGKDTCVEQHGNASTSLEGTGSNVTNNPQLVASKLNVNTPNMDPVTKSFIPSNLKSLPPTVTISKSDVTYGECTNNGKLVEVLRQEKLTFAIQKNVYVHLKLINMNCCINKWAWCFSTDGLMSVGQDEILYLIEMIDDEKTVPVDIFHHINSVYIDAVKGTTVTELSVSLHSSPNFLDFKNHAGFLYIRPSFQCVQNVIRPSEPFLVGLLIHRWEMPWAKIFPLRLVLRLGAEYRYYPSPIISTRHRNSVFVEIGHTIIKLLADFRNYSYTLPKIRGLVIHMEEKNTTVIIPANRYDQVVKTLSNSSDHILAFSGNFSSKADSHLVCIQDTQDNNENTYTTHAINIQDKPRKVTGASFIVFNGALKTSSGLTAKSSIVEDGLMIQIPSEQMVQVRESLRNMKDYVIHCGCVNAPSDETVNIVWGEPEANFNIGVTSPIDNQCLSGTPSIRVHNGKDYVSSGGNRLIRWTEVFIVQNSEETSKAQDPIDISKISESISKATCQALIKYLDLLSGNGFHKIGIRTTLHVENVSYCAGSNGFKLPPIYMKNLDNELIPVLHRITSNNLGDTIIVLELIFRILNT